MVGTNRGMRSRLVACAVLVLLTVSGSTAMASTTSPLVGRALWVDPGSPAAQAAAAARASGDTQSAALLAKLAARPTAVWLSSGSGMATRVANVVRQASAAGAVPVFVTYYLPGRDCGGYSSGGAPSFSAYAAWVNTVASAIGDATAAVVVEPDAIAEMTVGCLRGAASWYAAALSSEVSTLKRLPHVAVYLDAGNPNWVLDPRQLVAPLRASGLANADGFALNVSNFRSLTDDLDYGWSLSTSTGGAHFVVDTSRNGLGPLPAGSTYPGPSWCNPPGRAVGVPPSTSTGHHTVDAFLWVKTPGASDGTCGLGDPPAGTFWTSYALGLISRAAW